MSIEHIFRAYDIRGIYPTDLNSGIMQKIGSAFATFLKRKGIKAVAVGGDIRGTTVELKNALIFGIQKVGLKVHRVQTSPLGLALFEAFDHKLGASAFVTASHLPPEWNGVKFYWGEGVGFSPEENDEVHTLFSDEKFDFSENLGEIEDVDTYEKYLLYLKSKFHFSKRFNIAVDCGNGATAVVMPNLFQDLDLKVNSIFDVPDPTFPNRPSEPNEKTLHSLSEFVSKGEYDFGAGFDGDGDRCVFTDQNGKVIPSENAGLIIGKYLLNKSTGNSVIINEECSKMIEDEFLKLGAQTKRIRVGHSFLSLEAKDTKAIWGIEASGHAIAPEIFLFDDALILPLLMAKALEFFGKDLATLNESIPFVYKKRYDLKCPDDVKFRVVDEVKSTFERMDGEISVLDGVALNFPKGRVLVRVSNTSPKVRVTIESSEESEYLHLESTYLPIVEQIIYTVGE